MNENSQTPPPLPTLYPQLIDDVNQETNSKKVSREETDLNKKSSQQLSQEQNKEHDNVDAQTNITEDKENIDGSEETVDDQELAEETLQITDSFRALILSLHEDDLEDITNAPSSVKINTNFHQRFKFCFSWLSTFAPVNMEEIGNNIIKDYLKEKDRGDYNKTAAILVGKSSNYLNFTLLQKPPSMTYLMILLALYYEKIVSGHFYNKLDKHTSDIYCKIITIYLKTKADERVSWRLNNEYNLSNRLLLGQELTNLANSLVENYFGKGERGTAKIRSFSENQNNNFPLNNLGNFIVWLYWTSNRLGWISASHFCLKMLYWSYDGSVDFSLAYTFGRLPDFYENKPYTYQVEKIFMFPPKYIKLLKDMHVLSNAFAPRFSQKYKSDAGLMEATKIPIQIKYELNIFLQNPILQNEPILEKKATISAIGVVDRKITDQAKEYTAFYDKLSSLDKQSYAEQDLNKIKEQLMLEFPWMIEVIQEVMMMLHLQNKVSSYVLYGSPGCGKTYFVTRLAKLLNAKFHLHSLSGTADNRLLQGTGRGWGSATPSLPVIVLCQKSVINPIILIDELDKHVPSHNGSAYDTLVHFLEPTTSQTYYDECLMTQVDVSEINWLFSANSLQNIPSYLMSRLEPIYCNRPKKNDLENILQLLKAKWIEEKKAEKYQDELQINPFIYERHLSVKRMSIKSELDLDLRVVQKNVSTILYTQIKKLLSL